MTSTRLIERWLPIAQIGIESVRERALPTAMPAVNYLHVWWARRPLVAARAAVLASVLPEDADQDAFMHALGIHGDPIAAKARIARADRLGERLGSDAYGYSRAFSHNPTSDDMEKLVGNSSITVLDPTAGGGAIPFEAHRLGFTALANDLNPVASLIEKATLEYPAKFGSQLLDEFREIGPVWAARLRDRLSDVFPDEPDEDCRPDGYLWARTVVCPYCAGTVPLSPNWRLAPNGTGVCLIPHVGTGPGDDGRECSFEIVRNLSAQSQGTVAGGDGVCPFPDCGRAISGDEIKRQSQMGQMGDQLFTVVYKRQVITKTSTGKNKIKWLRDYRAPMTADDIGDAVIARLNEKMPEWEAMDIVPSEEYPGGFADRSKIYGVKTWRDLFSPRQLLTHGTGVEVFREMIEEERASHSLSDAREAAYVYLSIAMDKLLNYNSRMSVWMSIREVVANTFNRHDFAFCWSYAEMASVVEGQGLDWAIKNTGKALKELAALMHQGVSER